MCCEEYSSFLLQPVLLTFYAMLLTTFALLELISENKISNFQYYQYYFQLIYKKLPITEAEGGSK